MPTIRVAADRTEAMAAANDLRVFTESIEFYSSAEGGYPATMTYEFMPDSIAGYLPAAWKNGEYNWFYINAGRLVYAYFFNLGLTTEQLIRIDSIIDDGNITSGDIRLAFGGNGFFYIFQLPTP